MDYRQRFLFLKPDEPATEELSNIDKKSSLSICRRRIGMQNRLQACAKGLHFATKACHTLYLSRFTIWRSSRSGEPRFYRGTQSTSQGLADGAA